MQVKAQLLAAGRLGVAANSISTVASRNTSASDNMTAGAADHGADSTAAATPQVTPKNTKQNNSLVTDEVIINDVSMSARNYLTRTATQDEINKVWMQLIFLLYCH